MPINMHSEKTLAGLAIFYGLCKALQKVIAGESPAMIAVYFLGAAVVGTLVTMGVIAIILAVLGKGHHLIVVTNWVMLLGVCLAIITAMVLGSV